MRRAGIDLLTIMQISGHKTMVLTSREFLYHLPC
jgi:hypothetical protein